MNVVDELFPDHVVSIRVDVNSCARCGQDHKHVPFREFDEPLESSSLQAWRWWGLCPTTLEPVLLEKLEQGRGRDTYVEIENECVRQTEMWGPAHDDEHSWRDWFALVSRYLVKADVALVEDDNEDEWRGRLVQLAAIVVSAIRSIDRQRRAVRLGDEEETYRR